MGLQDSIGKAINPLRERERSINMQMKIMTRSAYFKGFCVIGRRFHWNKAIFRNLQEKEVLKKGVYRGNTFRSAPLLLVSDRSSGSFTPGHPGTGASVLSPCVLCAPQAETARAGHRPCCFQGQGVSSQLWEGGARGAPGQSDRGVCRAGTCPGFASFLCPSILSMLSSALVFSSPPAPEPL